MKDSGKELLWSWARLVWGISEYRGEFLSTVAGEATVWARCWPEQLWVQIKKGAVELFLTEFLALLVRRHGFFQRSVYFFRFVLMMKFYNSRCFFLPFSCLFFLSVCSGLLNAKFRGFLLLSTARFP